MATCKRTERVELVAQPPTKAVRIVPVLEEYDLPSWPKVVVTEVVYNLQLNQEEAETLRMIGWRVGGDPGGRRGHMDAITHALDMAGLSNMYEEQRALSDTSRIYFR